MVLVEFLILDVKQNFKIPCWKSNIVDHLHSFFAYFQNALMRGKKKTHPAQCVSIRPSTFHLHPRQGCQLWAISPLQKLKGSFFLQKYMLVSENSDMLKPPSVEFTRRKTPRKSVHPLPWVTFFTIFFGLTSRGRWITSRHRKTERLQLEKTMEGGKKSTPKVPNFRFPSEISGVYIVEVLILNLIEDVLEDWIQKGTTLRNQDTKTSFDAGFNKNSRYNSQPMEDHPLRQQNNPFGFHEQLPCKGASRKGLI